MPADELEEGSRLKVLLGLGEEGKLLSVAQALEAGAVPGPRHRLQRREGAKVRVAVLAMLGAETRSM